MKSKTYLALLVLLILPAIAANIAAKPVDVIIEPTELGKPSRILSVVNPVAASLEVLPARGHRISSRKMKPWKSRSYDYVLSYDSGVEGTYLGGLAQTFHLGVWFESPAACTLLAIFYDFAVGGDVTYYVADPSDTIDFLNDYEEYHGGSNPGPDPRETFLHPEESRTAPVGWDTLYVTSMPNVARNIFFAAYIMDDGVSQPFIDAGISPPYHTLMQRPGGGGGPFGWYSSWHHVYIRALVRMYENPPPMVETYDDLPNSYLTTGRAVTATFADIGIPFDSSGVVAGWTHYRIDNGNWDSLSMLLISGDSTFGIWETTLPGINPGQTMEYWFRWV